MCSVTSAGKAVLDCSVLEVDWYRGQSYSAHWHSLSLVPQYHHRPTVMEVDYSQKQYLFKQWEARRPNQRCLSGAIHQESLDPRTHRTGSPSQLSSTPSSPGARAQRASTNIQKDAWSGTVPERAAVGAGLGRELPTEKRFLVKISKMPRSLGRVLSQEAHRG